MTYYAVARGVLKPNAAVINIIPPGKDLSDLDVGDIYLRKKYEAGKKGWSSLVEKSKRNGTVIDSFTEVRVRVLTCDFSGTDKCFDIRNLIFVTLNTGFITLAQARH